MTDTPLEISDEDLGAYIDGELDVARHEQVAAAIAGDAVLAGKFANFSKQKVDLHALYDSYAKEPVPARLLDIALAAPAASPTGGAAAAPPSKSQWMSLAAGIALFVAGGVGGWFSQYIQAPDSYLLEPIIRQAVLAHQILESEAPDDANRLTIENDDIVAVGNTSVGNIAAGFEVPIRAPALKALGRYTPVAVRETSGGTTAPTAQLLYRDVDQGFISLYVKPHSTRRGLPFDNRELDGYNTVYWIDGPLTYVLVGRKDPAQLADMAQAIYRSRGIGETKPAILTTE